MPAGLVTDAQAKALLGGGWGDRPIPRGWFLQAFQDFVTSSAPAHLAQLEVGTGGVFPAWRSPVRRTPTGSSLSGRNRRSGTGDCLSRRVRMTFAPARPL